MYTVPVPNPFSLQAITPGVREKRYGNSFAPVENSSKSALPMRLTANGASFGALTAFTTSSFKSSTRIESCSLSRAQTVLATPANANAARNIPFMLFLSFRNQCYDPF